MTQFVVYTNEKKKMEEDMSIGPYLLVTVAAI
jgi:hypothetical protein